MNISKTGMMQDLALGIGIWPLQIWICGVDRSDKVVFSAGLEYTVCLVPENMSTPGDAGIAEGRGFQYRR